MFGRAAPRRFALGAAALVLLSSASAVHGQDADVRLGADSDAHDAGPTACVNEASHRFDFLAGEWIAHSRRMDETGQWHEATNPWSVETVLGGCAFVDYVDGDFGSGRFRGMGSRYYEPEADRWTITWMSTDAPGVLEMWEGGFDEAGAGHFYQEIDAPDGTVISRIRWWDIRDDAVEWEHALSRDGGETWSPTWRMTLRRAAE